MRTESMSISEFMRGREPEPFSTKIERHIKKYGMVYKIAGVTLIILTSGLGGHAFAATTLATGSLDREAYRFYRELVRIGKWLIVIKGGIDIIKCVGSGDFDAAKKHCFSYIMIYLLLLGLPYGMQKVDDIVANITMGH